MDTQIAQVLQLIDTKIATLQKARDMLSTAFGNGSTSKRSPQGEMKGRRKVELAAFLLKHGPMVRTQIVERSGIPEGTISYCLSDKRFFEQQESGHWFITEFSQEGFQKDSTLGPIGE